MDNWIDSMARHGGGLVFAVCLVEALGLPVPAAIVLLTAGALVALGKLALGTAILAAVTAFLLGDIVYFLLGRYTGWWLLGILCRISANPDSCILTSAEAFYRLGKIRLDRKQYSKAFEALQVVAVQYPSTTHFDEIIGLQYHIGSSLLDGARGRVWGIFPGFQHRDKGIEYLKTTIFEAPYSDYSPIAMMSVARGYQYFKETAEAIDALDQMVNSFPQHPLTPEAYLYLGLAHASLVEGPYYDQASTRDAITFYEDFMILFPSDNNVASAEKGLIDMKKVLAESKMKIADFYFKRRSNYKAARVFYNEAITVYPDSDIAKLARERLTEVDAAVAKSTEPQPKKKRFYFF